MEILSKIYIVNVGCVCVCVWERERERKRGWILTVKQEFLWKNLQRCLTVMNDLETYHKKNIKCTCIAVILKNMREYHSWKGISTYIKVYKLW